VFGSIGRSTSISSPVFLLSRSGHPGEARSDPPWNGGSTSLAQAAKASANEPAPDNVAARRVEGPFLS
jgi:hypothetical protein